MNIQLFILVTLLVASSFQDQITPIWKNNLLTTIPKWGKEYRVSFDIQPTSKLLPLANIIHFTVGGDCCNLGQRIPGVWFQPNTMKLIVSSGLLGAGNEVWNDYRELPLKKFTSVVIQQIQNAQRVYVYAVSLNGRVVYKTHNTHPIPYKNVKVYAGSPYHMAANAVLKNLQFTVVPEFTGNIRRGRLLTTIQTWGKEWRLRFKIKPLSKRTYWTNILHLTTGKNNGPAGSRIPAILVIPNSMRMLVFTQLGTHNFWRYTSPKDLPVTKYTNVHIEQLMDSHGKFYYKIIIDGKVVVNKLQTKATDYKNVKVYASDPWYFQANVYVRDLHLEGISGQHYFTTL